MKAATIAVLAGCIILAAGCSARTPLPAPEATSKEGEEAAARAIVSAESATHAMRALGKIAVTFREFDDGATETRYDCETPEAAAILASKRRGDLLSFGNLRVTSDGSLALDGTGLWRLSTENRSLIERFTPSPAPSLPKEARHFAVTPRLSLSPSGDPSFPSSHPAWLDGFDRWGAAMWVGGGGTPMDIPGDFEWLRSLGLGMCVAVPGGEEDCFAPGEMDFSQYDWYETVARRYGLPFRLLTHVGRFPWCWQTDPLPHVFPGDPRYVGLPALYYADVLTTGAMNAGVPGVPSDRYRFDARRRLAERLGGDDSPLLGWHVCEELTCGKLVWLASCSGTPAVQREWRDWARDTLGVADPGPVPGPEDFLPRDPARDIDLFGIWDISTDGGKSWSPGPCNDAILLFFSRSWHVRPPARYDDVLMRRAFDVPAGSLDAARYLHIASAAYKTVYGAPPDVTVNGIPCERLPGDFSRCYDLGPALREGRNEILVNAHGTCLPGYVYLTGKPLALYPNLGEALNRRWYDAVNFGSHLRVRYIEDRIRAVRAADPVRPLKMMAVKEAQDEALGLCRRYGAYFHDTGAAGGYWCPYSGARLSSSHGLPWSCEQGGPPLTPEAMRAAISRYLQYGNDAADLVFAIGNYRSKNPEVRVWCEENLGLLRAIGKTRLVRPRVAILRSSRAVRLGFGRDVETRDPGRGLLQSAGYEFEYLEIPDLREPAVIDRYPVVIDCATAVMEARDAAAIRRYVEAGGTFVALPTTGLHLPERAAARPLDAAFADAAPDIAARFVRLAGWPSMKDFGGTYVPAEGPDTPAPTLRDVLRRTAGEPDWETATPRFWASPRLSKNGVFDVVVATRMENPGEGVAPAVEATARVRLATAPDAPLPRTAARASGAAAALADLPAAQYAPMETRLFVLPRPDPGRAGLRWIEALAAIWHPVERVEAAEAAPVVPPSPDVIVLRDGWAPCPPAHFATLGWPENTNATFRTVARVPAEWLEAGDAVDLKMHCGFVMRGLSPWGRVTVNGRPVPGYAPFKGFRQGGAFVLDVTDAARESGGKLEIAIEIDGSKSAEDPKNFGGRPNGAGATFALHRRRRAAATIPLENWRACVNYGDTTPVAPGQKVAHRWFECRFPTPSGIPPSRPTAGTSGAAAVPAGARIYLAADAPLRGLLLNNRYLNVPDGVGEIDVTGLLAPPGGLNTLRWCDTKLHGFAADAGDLLDHPSTAPLHRMELRIIP